MDIAEAPREVAVLWDVILVSLNYRVGCLGFLSLESQSVGNAGMKDMVQALKWVNANIKQFGGDPNNVTIFGTSAGAAAVHYLVISPLAKNLFHKAICQSGSALAPWTIGKQNNAIDIAKIMGCTKTDDDKILEFLRNATKEDLLSTQDDKIGDPFSIFRLRYFCPTVEPQSANAFMTDTPADLVLAGKVNKVPFMLGYNLLEGMLFAELKGMQDMYPIDFTNFVPHLVGGKSKPELNKQIMQFYFGQDDVDLTNREGLYRVLTDADFARPAFTAVRNHARNSSEPVYFYRFSYQSNLNMSKQLMGITTPGVPHGGDNNYLFRNT